jgi:hypothetical protein
MYRHSIQYIDKGHTLKTKREWLSWQRSYGLYPYLCHNSVEWDEIWKRFPSLSPSKCRNNSQIYIPTWEEVRFHLHELIFKVSWENPINCWKRMVYDVNEFMEKFGFLLWEDLKEICLGNLCDRLCSKNQGVPLVLSSTSPLCRQIYLYFYLQTFFVHLKEEKITKIKNDKIDKNDKIENIDLMDRIPASYETKSTKSDKPLKEIIHQWRRLFF